MNSNFGWLVGVIVMVGVAGWATHASQRSEPTTTSTVTSSTSPSGNLVISDADRAAAQKLLHPANLPDAENQRRLVFYDALRDQMDANAFGVLEAVADLLRRAPGHQVSPGFDIRTFYSAVGGDTQFKGGGEEDWSRLLDFSTRWMRAFPGSPLPLIARAQTRMLSAVHKTGRAAGVDDRQDALADLGQAMARPSAGRHEPCWLETLNELAFRACLAGDRANAAAAFKLLGKDADWSHLAYARQIDLFRKWAVDGAEYPMLK